MSVLEAVAVEKDYEGLRKAMLELLEESLTDTDELRRIAELSEDPNRVLAGSSKRTRSSGYYVWISYLLSLEQQFDAGLSFAFNSLPSVDAEGLVILSHARKEFDALHPRCSCGRRMLNPFAKACGRCGTGA